MSKTIEEFKEELRILREELMQGGETADTRMLASYLDRLIISLQGLCETLDSLDIGVETLSEAEEPTAKEVQVREIVCECPCCCQPPAAKRSKPKKAAKAKKKAK